MNCRGDWGLLGVDKVKKATLVQSYKAADARLWLQAIAYEQSECRYEHSPKSFKIIFRSKMLNACDTAEEFPQLDSRWLPSYV